VLSGKKERMERKRILIVEDEPAIAENIAFAVQTENMEPVVAGTAGEGREILSDDQIDLIVLDVGLPDENGFDFCRQVRAVSDVPIIFLTARKEEVDRIVGLEIGGDDYMAKPFSPRELTARIRAILRRIPTTGKSFPTIGKSVFEVDDESKTIHYHGQPLELSRCEFLMLELFIGHPGQVFSRAQLMDHAWEEPDASFDRTVDTHIKTLRAKLHKIRPDENPIQTRRGFGYCLKVEA
jgi:two-component system catabolic regulation response regulator CreB